MLIKASNVSKSYGRELVLNQLNLEIEKGQLVAYIGTNGAGKSTTIKILTGLLKQSQGQVERAENLKMGIVFQDSILDPELTVQDNLKSRFALYKEQDWAWFERVLDLLGVRSLLKKSYGTLSGGQRRCVDIARSLLNQPDILFLDEPTTGLDVQTRQGIWKLLRRLQREQGLTIFLTTHYLEEAENADMTYIIDRGSLLAQGSAEVIKSKYAPNQLHLQVRDRTVFEEMDCQVEGERVVFERISLEAALAILADYREIIADFDYVKGTINTAFLAITGREMV